MFYAPIFFGSKARFVNLFYPALTSVASFSSLSPNILQFWKLPRFYLCRCFDVIMLFCSIKSVQNKLKEWNIFSTGLFTYMPGIIQDWYGNFLTLLAIFSVFLLLSYFLLFLLFFFLEILHPTPSECPPWVGRKKTAYLNKVTLSYK